MKTWIILMLFLTSCFSPARSKNKQEIVTSMATAIEKKFSKINHLSINDYLKLKSSNEQIVLIDVREKKERDISYIPGSISKEEFIKNPSKYKDHHVIAYCTIGLRSSEFISDIKAHGFKKVSNLKESILGWTHHKLELINNNGKTNRVHVYGEPWNMVQDNYQGITE